jgi:VIT1/CCC1 family predicted Fe2+/Mn2+ transporter
MRLLNREYLRSVVFGIEDSLVSTTGLITGLSVGSDDKSVVVLGGVIAICIEAVSMGAGEYLSDDAVRDLDKISRHNERPLISGLLMFVSYLLAGFVPLLPILLLPLTTAIYLSIVLALVGLFSLGFAKGKILHTSPTRGAVKILIVGGLATGLGVAVGFLFKI